jgi:hypothetical protein
VLTFAFVLVTAVFFFRNAIAESKRESRRLERLLQANIGDRFGKRTIGEALLTSLRPGAILGLFDIWSTSALLPRRR